MTSLNVTILTKIKHIHCAYYVHYTGGRRMPVANALAKRSKLRMAKVAIDKRLPHCQN